MNYNIMAVRQKSDAAKKTRASKIKRSKKNKINLERTAQFKKNMADILVESINMKEFSCKVCKQGRFHSPVCRLSKSLRKYFNFRNKGLISHDVVNCQPLLSLVLLDSNLFQKNKIMEIVKKVNPTLNDVEKRKEFERLVYMSSSNADVRSYIKHVKEGVLYEEFFKFLSENAKTK